VRFYEGLVQPATATQYDGGDRWDEAVVLGKYRCLDKGRRSRVNCKTDEIFENQRNIQGRRMCVYDANDKAEHI
jgi:hypothetical protein